MAALRRLCGAGAASAAAQAALHRPLVLRLPPEGSRGKFGGEIGNYGKIRSTGQPSGGMRPMDGSTRGRPGGSFAPLVPTHHQALQRLSEQLMPLAGDLGALAGGPLKAMQERGIRVRKNNDRIQQEEIFEQARSFMMEPELWTYGNMAAYQRKVLELAGATGWRRRFSADEPSILHLEKELRVLEAMTPTELQSNHKSVFTKEAKKLIAEKAGCTVRYVDQVLLEHDILRADRRWYKIRLQFKKPLPATFEDRAHMGEYDRPFSETELEMQEEMMEKQRRNFRHKKPPRFNCVYFRKPSCGGNRWSARPPRWYPAQWRMRPERRARLRGVGRPGGGGDRGRPWGHLARYLGPGGARLR